MAKRGRKTLFKDYMIEQAYKLGALGLIQTEIATIWGVSAMSLNRWSKKHPEFGEAIKRGREEADLSVIQALLKECREKGNITGIIFWLKNRIPDKWRDNYKHEHSGKVRYEKIEVKIIRTPEEANAEIANKNITDMREKKILSRDLS